VHTSKFGKQLTQLASFFALALLSCQGFAQNWDIDRIVTFGASLSDTGNSFVWLSDPANSSCGTQLNVPPYDKLDDLLVPDGPYAKGGHHLTNGATWVEGVARYLALAGNTRPAFRTGGKKASNYAVGGARAIADFPCRFNFPAQVGRYLTDFGSTSDSTLVAIEIGGNYVRDALIAALTPGGNPQQRIQDALTSFGNSIFQLYFSGARHLLVLNVPDIGKAPSVRAIDQTLGAGGAIIALAGDLADGYNDGLVATVALLEGSLPGIHIKILDVHQTLDDVITSPETYGFSNATDACVTPNQPPFKCAKPDEYVFWDGIHPTKAMHAIVAQQAIARISAP
jgi:phospholipase/lecithinase/hemolysin